jgi:hypothetical protein
MSTNAGQSFQFLKFLDAGAPSGTSSIIDYPAVTTGPGRNADEKSVWLAWRGSNGKIMVTGAPVTAKGVVGTFLANQEVTGSLGMGMPRAAVGPNGQMMVAYSGVAIGGATTVPIYTNVDDDGLDNGGFRASAKHVADTTVLLKPNPPFTIIPAQPNRGITPQVNLAWDRSGNYVAAPNGRVYLTYTYSFGGGDTDIAKTTSDDSGMNWTPWQVLFPNSNSQFLPSVAVDQTNGDVAVVWLDARDDTNNVKVKLYGTVSGDGGATWEGLAGPYAIAAGQSDATRTDLPQRGTTTGGNTTTTLNDTTQSWLPNNYWRTNFRVLVPGVSDLPRDITGNTATELTIHPDFPWPAIPGAGESYSIETRYTLDYGEYTGLAFHNGAFYAVWADNSNSTGDNPNGTRGWLDLYTARGTVLHQVEETGPLAARGGLHSSAPLGSPDPGHSVKVSPASSNTIVDRGTASNGPSDGNTPFIPLTDLVWTILNLGALRLSSHSVYTPPFLPPVALRVTHDPPLNTRTSVQPLPLAALLSEGDTSDDSLLGPPVDPLFAVWADMVFVVEDPRRPLG